MVAFGEQLALDGVERYGDYDAPLKLGTRTLAQEVAAALRRETDDQVLRRWAGASICHCGSMDEACTKHHVLAALRWGWLKPVTPVKAMTPSQLKAELTRQYKRLSKGVEYDAE